MRPLLDDSPLASRIWPAMTTVRLPIRDMGRMAAEKLISKIEKSDAKLGPTATVVPHLVVRQSSAEPG